jgi:hypothetical protein
MKESLEQSMETQDLSDGFALPFISARKNILSSYFQMVNLMMLQRVNGDSANRDSYLHSLSNEMSDELQQEFGVQGKGIFGDFK